MNVVAPSDSGTLDSLRRDLSKRYDIVDREIVIGTTEYLMTMVRDINTLVDSVDPTAFAVDERLPYWAELWSSSIGLAGLLMQGSAMKGKAVLELGCGLGLAGVAAANAGAQVLFTDYEDDALRFARYNAMRNLGTEAFSTVRLKNIDCRVTEEIGTFDVVIGADILYERKNFGPLLTMLERCLRPAGYAIITDPSRAVALEFVELARISGFRVDAVSTDVTFNQRTGTVVHYTVRNTRHGDLQRGMLK